ncbi:Uncharacterized protein J7T55_000336 [Diaporthe amygdali]|uniref:uncharacterized protein n=1 Tax=Phomopsis amygdali TaxID=1214568 RepID=UPI0022FE15EE|nr:uncharacterized protein J7T55_000336 [Diaporthe amygdali]KAJ0109411.1 Uncharacterized protein J7T55_000336 [Diaporthe amygdali]
MKTCFGPVSIDMIISSDRPGVVSRLDHWKQGGVGNIFIPRQGTSTTSAIVMKYRQERQHDPRETHDCSNIVTISEPIDITSLMEASSDVAPFRGEPKGSRGAGKPRCGVCLFLLSPGAHPSNIDADKDITQTVGTYLKFTRKEFVASADRGCTSCRNILKFALHRGAIQLESDQGPFWRGISISDSRMTHGYFIFLTQHTIPMTDSYQGYPLICRGNATANLEGTAENRVLDRARRWWEMCNSEHNCRRRPCSYIPRRLLRIEHNSDETASVVWLVEDLTEPVEYIALSHRWSEETKAISLLNSNRCQRIEEGLPCSHLPHLSEFNTFPELHIVGRLALTSAHLKVQDTVHVLRQFQLDYLWVDCMCIIQGDSADWKHEASSVASIYKNATFTISATHCRGSSESLFSDPNKFITGEYIADLPGGISVHLEEYMPHPFAYHGIRPEGQHSTELMDSGESSTMSLLSRGWVYQELLLSPRTLYFLEHEIMWRCREHAVCQCARYDLDDITTYNNNVTAVTDSTGTEYYSRRNCQPISSRAWTDIVESYSSRSLTYAQDKLAALAGIAEEYGKDTGWTYLCGLWQEIVLKCLCWYRKSSIPAPRPDASFPTWSWASTATSVGFPSKSVQEIQFESCHITYKNEGSPYVGDIEVAVLNIRGDAFPANLTPCSDHDQLKNPSLSGFYQRYDVSVMSSFTFVLTEDCVIPELFISRLGTTWLPEDNLHPDWRTHWNVSTKQLALV